MSTVFAERFNFGFVLFSLVILSSLLADTNGITTDGVPDLSLKPTEELPVDKLNSSSTISQKDNLINGYPSDTTRAQTNLEVTATQGETETDNLSTTETNRNSEVSHNASVEPKSITTPETSRQYSSLAVSETTFALVEGDQTSTANSDVEASWSAKVNTTSEPVQNNSIQHQENINLHFIGNSLDDVSNNSTENKTAIADSNNTKPTKKTIVGIGIKTTVSVSLRVKDAKITGTNLTDEGKTSTNASFKGSSNNNTDAVNTTCSESIENATAADNTNDTAYSDVLRQKSSDEPPTLNSTPVTDQQNSTETSLNATDSNRNETEPRSHQPNTSENYLNRTDVNSNVTHNNTENDSNIVYKNETETDMRSTQLNTTENVTEATVFEESRNSTNASSTKEHRIPDVSLPDNTTTEAHFEVSTSTITNNETSENVTTHVKTHSPISSTSWSTTDVETENATEAELITTTPQPMIRFMGVMKIVHGLNWTEELSNRQSLRYKKAARRIKSLLEDVFSSTTNLARILKEVEIDGFSQGSVLVDYFLTLLQSDKLDPGYLVHAFNSYFKSNHTYSNVTIDPKATEFEVVKVKAAKPTADSHVEPPVPQWIIAVVVIAAASLVFIILFAAVTIYGRHYGRRSYNKKLQGDEIIFDKPDYQSGPRLSDAAYENLAADAVYDVESSPEKSEGMTNRVDNQFDSWRTNQLTRIPSSKRFSFNSS